MIYKGDETHGSIRCRRFARRVISALTLLLTAGCAISLAQSQGGDSGHEPHDDSHGSIKFKHQGDYSDTPGAGRLPAAPIPDLVYYGGRIVSNPSYYNIYWGPNVARYGGSIDAFVGDLGTLNFNSLLSQYATTGHSPGTSQVIGPGIYAGSITATPSARNSGSTVDDTAIQSQLQAWITAGTIPAPTRDAAGNNNTIYNVLFPPGVTITQGGSLSCVSGGFCAYHGAVAVGVTPEFYYTVIPDLGSTSGCFRGCGASTNPLQNLTSVLSHEVAEVITDAEVSLATQLAPPLAWYDAVNGEIGDICNAGSGTMTGPTGASWNVQTLWSNAQQACIMPPQVLQVITFSALPNRTVGTAPFTVTATSNTGFSVNFTGGAANVCSITPAGLVTILGAGTCSVTANQPGGPIGSTAYAAATPVTRTFTITGGLLSQTITFPALANQVLGALPFSITATASSGLPVSFASLTAAVCTVSGSTVTLVATGQCSIQATQAGNATYAAAAPGTQSFTVTSTGPPSSIVNGGFETGDLSGWTSTGFAQSVTGGHSGNYAARVGSTGPSTNSSLAQTFTAPAGAATLTFWYKVVCPDTITFDWASATLMDNTAGTTATVLANTCTNTGIWVQASAGVTAGHSYTLTLANHDDNYPADPTYTLYDDVTVNTGTPPPPPSGIVNGGFETGTLTGWMAAGTASVVGHPHSGSYSAQLGGTTATNGDSTVTQTFTAPAAVSQFSLYYNVHCPDTVTFDWASVTLVDNTAGTTNTVVARTCTNTGAWVSATAPVVPGHSYTLTLLSHDDNYPADPTYTWYDDVILQ